MKFNGVDPTTVHPAIRISKEIPPGMPTRQLRTLAASDGEILTGKETGAGRYVVRINIAARTPAEAWEAREKLAAWADGSGEGTNELEPTHRPERVYDAAVESISDPEFEPRFAVVDVTFLVPRPIARSRTLSTARGTGRISLNVTGSSRPRPVIRQTLKASAQRVTWTMDGREMLDVSGSFAAGQVLEMDTAHERLTIDGAVSMTVINPQASRWRPGFTHGAHTIQSTDGGEMEMRWHEEWL